MERLIVLEVGGVNTERRKLDSEEHLQILGAEIRIANEVGCAKTHRTARSTATIVSVANARRKIPTCC